MRARFWRVLGAALFAMAASRVDAHWAWPTEMPIERVVENLTKVVQEHPHDAGAHYTLGRARSFAFINAASSIGVHVWDQEGTIRLPDDWHEKYFIDRLKQSGKVQDLPPEEAQKELVGAISALQEAIRLDGNRPEYHLTLAYTLEKGVDFANRCDVVPTSTTPVDEAAQREIWDRIVSAATTEGELGQIARGNLERDILRVGPTIAARGADERASVRQSVATLLPMYWRERALEEYVSAFRGAYPEDQRLKEQPLLGLCALVSHEAGQNYLRLVKERPAATTAIASAKPEIEEGIERLKAIPPCRAITPMIISTRPSLRLRDLLDRDAAVPFDLDGDGRTERWDWVKPEAGILVWDPTETGRITSGRQLFGTATWWMYFSDGYAALDALDDSRDGWLRGAELDGIAVWFDLDSNGRSGRGEVVPTSDLGISGIATRATGTEGGSMCNLHGVEWHDAATTASYDWVAAIREK